MSFGDGARGRWQLAGSRPEGSDSKMGTPVPQSSCANWPSEPYLRRFEHFARICIRGSVLGGRHASKHREPKDQPSGGNKAVSRSRAPTKPRLAGGPSSGGRSGCVPGIGEGPYVVFAAGSGAADDYGKN